MAVALSTEVEAIFTEVNRKAVGSRAGPLQWVHIALYSLMLAERDSAYRKDLRRLELFEHVGRSHAQRRGGAAPLDVALAQSQKQVAERICERYSGFAGRGHEAILAWLCSDAVTPPDDSLRAVQSTMSSFALTEEHFLGGATWEAVASRGDTKHWSEELNSMVGLEPVKSQVRGLTHLLNSFTARQLRGLPVKKPALHQVFVGGPGTGKTSVARIMGHIYRDAGLLKSGHVVDVDRVKLIGGYVGHTERQVNEHIEMALDGVLFIDEAYSLSAGEKDFGTQAIEILLNKMERHRDSLMVIVAGYPEPMSKFLQSNTGLQSRFKRTIVFEDYSREELREIFRRLAQAESFTIDESALDHAADALEKHKATAGASFGNARDARSLWELTQERQAQRVFGSCGNVAQPPTDEDLVHICLEDIPNNLPT